MSFQAATFTRAFVLVLLGLALAAGPARGQTRPAGGISGSIVDAASGEPIADATLTLEGATGSAFPSSHGGFLRGSRTTVTDELGEYHFDGIPPGDYRIHVQRVGYESASASVSFRGASDSRVSFGLRVAPLALRPLEVEGHAAAPVLPNAARVDPAALDRARIDAERARQDAYLSADVRVITRADVSDGITLGETDLFRAMQRLPGITTADEYSAELWTRGARWDQTRVYFDGMPLFNPLHAAGVFSGVNADALGAALLHPGVQPAKLGGGAAAVELSSRRTPLHPSFGTFGELSVVSARLTTDLFTGSERAGGLISVRRSYLDWLTRGIERVSGADDVYVPYHFHDMIVRLERQLGSRRSIELSSFFAGDAITGDVPDVLHRTVAEWGGGMTRVTFATPLAGLLTRHTLGVSHYGSNIWQGPALEESVYSAPEAPPAHNSLRYVTLMGDAQPVGDAGWNAGYEIVMQTGRYTGPRPGMHQDTPQPETTALRGSATHGAVYGTRRWTPTQRLSLQTGARVESGGPSLVPRIAPRLAARWQPDARLSFYAGAGRSYQYNQTVGAAGVRPVRGMNAEYVWLPAGADVPVVRSDIATLGAERWFGNAWLGSATMHARVSDGVAIADPTPGTFSESQPWVSARNTARGLELSLRRLTGRLTGSAAWTWSESEMDAAGLRFHADADRRHILDATAQLRLSRSWLFGAAYNAASGAPYTRTFGGRATCDERAWACSWTEEPWRAEPNVLRGRATQSLDVLTEWQRRFRGWQGSVFLQVRNALGTDNDGRYVGWQQPWCDGCAGADEFLPGAPLLPVIGFRVAF
jgi:hypothetical protein